MTEDSRQTDAAPAAPALEAKAAISEFARALRDFQDRIDARIKTQEDRIAMLDRKSAARPTLSTAAVEDAPHRKAFAAYLRNGDESGLRALSVERKGLSTEVAAEGGYLVDHQTAGRISSVLRGGASIRAIANVVQVQGGSLEILVDQADIESVWVTETAATPETASGRVERIVIPLHELAAAPKASQRLIDDSAFDIEAWIAERIAEKFARAETAAFVAGDGVDKPRGFLRHPQVANGEWSWGSIGYVATGVAGDFNSLDPSNDLIDLVYALGARYRANGVFVMNSRTVSVVRKMRDVEGRFLWTDSLSAGQPPRLLGHPVATVEDMPDIGADATPIAFGDFRAGYTVVERPELRILRDPFSAKPHVQFFATTRVGGDVSDFAAIKLLKLSVA